MERVLNEFAVIFGFALNLSLCWGCSSSAPAPTTAPLSKQTELAENEQARASKARDDSHAQAVEPKAAQSVASSEEQVVRQALFPEGVFPPPDPGAPFEKSAHDGDGVWRAFFDTTGEDTGSAKKGIPRIEREVSADFASDVARRLVIHPHEASRFQTLSVAAFDLRKLALAHRAGRQDVEDLGHAELYGKAGLVPAEEQSALLAVFNGGFQPRHGRWGMLSLGTQLIPPRVDGCTVAVLQNRTLRVAPWPNFLDADAKPTNELLAYRQTPPCLVVEGEVHAKLLKKERGPWAGQQADLKTRRRSAVGLSRDGRTLFFAVGSETEPETLAAGMLHVGAHFAAQLDINWNWTRLFLFEKEKSVENEQSPQEAPAANFARVLPVGALMRDMAKDRGEYVSRPGKRGFFTLTYR